MSLKWINSHFNPEKVIGNQKKGYGNLFSFQKGYRKMAILG